MYLYCYGFRTFSGNDSYCEENVTAYNVVVNSNAGDHDHGSSKVKFKNIVDYNWEQKMYTGQLLAVHFEGKFLAYSLTGNFNVCMHVYVYNVVILMLYFLVASQSNPGKANGAVRVYHRSTEDRALLRGMHGQVHDLSFAYISAQTLLACIDEEGNLYVFNIELDADNIVYVQNFSATFFLSTLLIYGNYKIIF